VNIAANGRRSPEAAAAAFSPLEPEERLFRDLRSHPDGLSSREVERAVEALASYLPDEVAVLRDGHRRLVEARTLVPGDVILLDEGDRVPADARLFEGTLKIDTSALTGESVPVTREAGEPETAVLLEARDLVFSGTPRRSGWRCRPGTRSCSCCRSR